MPRADGRSGWIVCKPETAVAGLAREKAKTQAATKLDESSVVFQLDTEKFWSRVQRGDPDECWPWSGSKQKSGYGDLRFQRKLLRAHRVAFILINGAIAKSDQVLHECDNPPCCNPNHLFVGNPKINSDDKIRKGRHAFGERAHGAIMTKEKVAAIRQFHKEHGGTVVDTAKKFKISKSVAYQIVKRVTWRHLP